METFRYTTAFNDIYPDNYLRTYTLFNALNAMRIEKEFLVNFNVMFILIIVLTLVLVGARMVKRKYVAMLEEEASRKVTAKLEKAEKFYSYMFSNIVLLLIFMSMNRIIFSFSIQMSIQSEN